VGDNFKSKYNVGTWSTCEFEVLFLRSKGKKRGERGKGERVCVCVCVNENDGSA